MAKVETIAGGTPWVTAFGTCPSSWNLEGDPEDEHYVTRESDGSGLPGIFVVAEALSTWVHLNARPATVELAAMVFNLPPELVRQAVEDSLYLYFDESGAIALDGA